MKKPKKSLITTIISVAVVAIVVAAAIFMYPYVVERKIGDILDDDFSDVVKIEMRNGDSGRRTETTDPDDIKYISDFATNIKVKKIIELRNYDGWNLSMKFIKTDGEEIDITFATSLRINGSAYKYDKSNGDPIQQAKDEIIYRYGLNPPLSEEEYEEFREQYLHYGSSLPSAESSNISSADSVDSSEVSSEWTPPTSTTIRELLGSQTLTCAKIVQATEDLELAYTVHSPGGYLKRFDNLVLTLSDDQEKNIVGYKDRIEFHVEKHGLVLSIVPNSTLEVYITDYSGNQPQTYCALYNYNVSRDELMDLFMDGYVNKLDTEMIQMITE